MATVHSCKLLLCALALACFFAEAKIVCEGGPEEGEAGEQRCCARSEMKEGKCPEQPSDMSVAVALTLILSFTFFISLQFFMNHSEVAVREYTYKIISSTISIFSAVLMFQSIDGLLDEYILFPLKSNHEDHDDSFDEHIENTVNLLQMLFWYAIAHLAIAIKSRALKPHAWRREVLAGQFDPHNYDCENFMLRVEISSTCFGIVLAHLTGFASINFWATIQSSSFKNNPIMALTPIPVCVGAALCIERLTEAIRDCLISRHGHRDFFEKLWVEKCQIAEDDIMGLALSVLLVNSLRFAINEGSGHPCLPDHNQTEEECDINHGISDVIWLFGWGWLFLMILILTKIIYTRWLQEEEDEEEVREDQKLRRLLHKSESLRTVSSEKRRPAIYELIERLEDVMLTTWGMAHAWCIYHGTRQLLMFLSRGFLGQKENETALAVCIASGVTYVTLILLYVMEFMTEHQLAGLSTLSRGTIKTVVVRGTSVFVGFAWEQTFDKAVDQLAASSNGGTFLTSSPSITKVVLASATVGVVFFNWKWHILPFVFKKGWRYGYVFTTQDLHDRCHELARHDSSFNVAHLHDIAKKLREKHTDRFDIESSRALTLTRSKNGFSAASSLRYSDSNADLEPTESTSLEDKLLNEGDAAAEELICLESSDSQPEEYLLLQESSDCESGLQRSGPQAKRKQARTIGRNRARLSELKLGAEKRASPRDSESAKEAPSSARDLRERLTQRITELNEERKKNQSEASKKKKAQKKPAEAPAQVVEAKPTEHLIEFLEYHLEQQRSRLRSCNRVGQEESPRSIMPSKFESSSPRSIMPSKFESSADGKTPSSASTPRRSPRSLEFRSVATERESYFLKRHQTNGFEPLDSYHNQSQLGEKGAVQLGANAEEPRQEKKPTSALKKRDGTTPSQSPELQQRRVTLAEQGGSYIASPNSRSSSREDLLEARWGRKRQQPVSKPFDLRLNLGGEQSNSRSSLASTLTGDERQQPLSKYMDRRLNFGGEQSNSRSSLLSALSDEGVVEAEEGRKRQQPVSRQFDLRRDFGAERSVESIRTDPAQRVFERFLDTAEEGFRSKDDSLSPVSLAKEEGKVMDSFAKLSDALQKLTHPPSDFGGV